MPFGIYNDRRKAPTMPGPFGSVHDVSATPPMPGPAPVATPPPRMQPPPGQPQAPIMPMAQAPQAPKLGATLGLRTNMARKMGQAGYTPEQVAMQELDWMSAAMPPPPDYFTGKAMMQDANTRANTETAGVAAANQGLGEYRMQQAHVAIPAQARMTDVQANTVLPSEAKLNDAQAGAITSGGAAATDQLKQAQDRIKELETQLNQFQRQQIGIANRPQKGADPLARSTAFKNYVGDSADPNMSPEEALRGADEDVGLRQRPQSNAPQDDMRGYTSDNAPDGSTGVGPNGEPYVKRNGQWVRG